MSIMQLERLLRSQGFGSRSECRSLICSERVRVGTERCVDPYAEFESDGFQFSVDNTGWTYRKFVYLALNKPANYECSHQPKHHSSVYSCCLMSCVIEEFKRLVGWMQTRQGCSFFQTMGSLFIPIRRLGSIFPRSDVTVKHPLDELQVAALLDGVCLHDSLAPVAAVRCEIRSERLLRMTVTEGRYHLVKGWWRPPGIVSTALTANRLAGSLCPKAYPSANGRGLKRPIWRAWHSIRNDTDRTSLHRDASQRAALRTCRRKMSCQPADAFGSSEES